MASIRDSLLTTLVSRINAISGITGQLRGSYQTLTQPVVGIVVPVGEDKRLANNNTYDANYRCEVMIIVRQEDAQADTDDSNPFRYLDRMITEVEKVVHTPDSWGVSPDYTDVEITGHEVDEPTDENEYVARLFITFTYRHDYQDPES